MVTPSSSSNQQFNAVMRIRDLRGYVMLVLLTFVVLIGLVFMADGFRFRLDGGQVIVLGVVSLAVGLFSWLGMWIIFGVLKIPAASTSISDQGLRVQNAYGFSSDLTWDEIIAVKTVSIPFMSQLVYLQAKNNIIYCMGQQYREKARFLAVLDRYAPADHAVRQHFL